MAETTKCDHDRIRGYGKTIAHIERYGLSVIAVEATDYLPSFAYSIGLWQKFRHPEIICFGLNRQVLHDVINRAAGIVKQGESIESGKSYDGFLQSSADLDLKVTFLEVDRRNLPDYFGTAIGYYQGADFPALQLLWPDKDNRFPWEEGFDEEYVRYQPLLDRNADFKFMEPKDLAVFTTKQWLELREPVLRVNHCHDGDWEFQTARFQENDIIIVCLEHMIAADTTLNEVFNLDYGEGAQREYMGGEWTRYVLEEEDDEDEKSS